MKTQIGAKANWMDSDDLCLMFTAAYSNEFYRALRDALHAEVDSWTEGAALPPSVWQNVFALEKSARNPQATTLQSGVRSWFEFDAFVAFPVGSTAEPGRGGAGTLNGGTAPHTRLLPLRGSERASDYEALCPPWHSYLCSHLRQQGFDVEVFDTTFSSREALVSHLRTEAPSTLGIYANLMTRKNVVEILTVAREAGWRTIVGGPEPGAYAREYLDAGADVVVFGEGELTVAELLHAFRHNAGYFNINGIAFLDGEGQNA